MSETAIKKIKFKKTDIEVTPIGLGTWQFAGGGGMVGRYWPAISSADMNKIVQAALEGGINWFDTAEAYGNGNSERNLSNALKSAGMKNGDVIIADKWNPVLRRAKTILSGIDIRLHYLNGYSIDLYQIHNPASISPLKTQIENMMKLVKMEKIRAIGVSNFSAKLMRKAYEELEKRDIPLVSNQVKYNLLSRKIEQNGILETAKELGIKIIAYSPLEQGLLTGRFHKNPKTRNEISFIRRNYTATKKKIEQTLALIQTLEEIAKTHNVSVSTIALNWLISIHGDNILAIPGASQLNQVKQNTDAMKIKLTTNEIKMIDKASLVINEKNRYGQIYKNKKI
jgi:aryl-alcohol dehydrogenase-like predicted oxidoreductase